MPVGSNTSPICNLAVNEVRAGRLASMRVEIDRLVEDAGFFGSPRVRQRFLEAAGER